MKPKGKRRLGLRCEQAIEQLEPLLYKKAYYTWQRLPISVRFWVDPEDLYQEAKIVALRCYLHWDPERAKFSTLVFTAVDNRMNTIVGWWRSRKHFSGIRVELDVVDLEDRRVRQPDLLVDGVVQMVFEQMESRDIIVELFGGKPFCKAR